MYTKTIGLWQKSQGLIDGAEWYFLTADYAFGHDLYRVSSRFLEENGGIILGNDMVPTNTLDYSSYILKIRQADPDFIYINLAGVDQTTFLKQYREYGLRLSAGRRRHGHGAVLGGRARIAVRPLAEPLVPWPRQPGGSGLHRAPSSSKYGKPPDNQAWGDYMGVKILLQGDRRDRRHRQHGAGRVSGKRRGVRHPEGPARQVPRLGPPAAAGDVRGSGQGAVRVPRTSGTSSSSSSCSPGRIEDLELIQPTQEENACNFEA